MSQTLLDHTGQPLENKDYDLNGNRFYHEYITERSISASNAKLKLASSLCAGLRISEGCAAMPVIYGKVTYDNLGRANKVPEPTATLAEKLSLRPNQWMTDVELRENVMLHALFEGTGRIFIERGRGKKIKNLLPVSDEGVTLARPHSDEPPEYKGSVKGYGSINGATRRDFIEVSNPRWDELCGLDITANLKEVLKLALSLQERQKEDASLKAVKGYFTFADAIGTDAADEVRKFVKDKLPDSPILDMGGQYKQLMPTASEMQLLESRKFLIEEVARAYGIHPLLLGHDGAGQSLTRVADVMEYHVTITLGPWVRRWEKAIAFSMLSKDEYVDLNERDFYRMNLKDRADYNSKALGSGGGHAWETQNDLRTRDGLNPVEGGDKLPEPRKSEAPKNDA